MLEAWPGRREDVLDVEVAATPSLAAPMEAARGTPVEAEALYVIFTSGSTGQPKVPKEIEGFQ